MKPSDIFKHLALNEVSGAIGKMVGVATGNTGSTGGFWASLTSGIPAVLSKDDERRFEVLLQQLDTELGPHTLDPGHLHFGQPMPRQYIIWFMQWHFKRRCAGEAGVSWWYRNEFQKFVVQLAKPKKEEPHTDENDGLDFLKWMVNTIHERGTEPGEQLQATFEFLLDQLEHVPHVPDSVTRFVPAFQRIISEAQAGAYQGYRDGKAALIHHRRRMEAQVRANNARPKSFLDKLIK